MEECFDLLDENGKPLGITKKRSLVHRDGDWHRSVHIWIYNHRGEILLQRRCPQKDSYPNMLDISCAGHLSAGDDSLGGAIRELSEELGLTVSPRELHYLTTLKESNVPYPGFHNNEFADIYFMKTEKETDDMVFQKEEISELLSVPYREFKEMVKRKQEDLLMHPEEFAALFNHLDQILSDLC